MHILAAATPDQTGQSIALLTAALIGVAVALGFLTIWYWRHTSPKRATVVEAPGRSPVSDTPARSAKQPSPAPLVAPKPILADDEDRHFGLDDEQWNTLTQGVLDTYFAQENE